MYYVGETPRGDRLFREFDHVTGSDALAAALDQVQRPAADPDYRTCWPLGSLGSASVAGGAIEVEPGAIDMDLSDLCQQQLVYTLQATVGERLPVRFADGIELTARPEAEVLSPVSISDPAEGSEYDGLFIARGRANVFEGTVAWEVQEPSGRTVLEGFATALGTGQRLYPWEARVDVSGLPAGSYTFIASGTDPSGGAELARLDHDTRTIVVR